MLAKKREWSRAAGAGALGGQGWSPRGPGQLGVRRGGGGAAQRRAGPARATKRSVSPAAGVPQRLPAHGQGGGSQPSREQTSPGEQTLTGFLCFRKAASATCPFPTPTQVGHPATSPCPALGVALRPAWPAPPGAPAPLPLGRYSESCVAARLPGSCGKRSLGRGTRGFWSSPQQRGHRALASAPPRGSCVRPACFPSQAGSARPHGGPATPQWGSSVPTLWGCLCACLCAEVEPRCTGVGTGASVGRCRGPGRPTLIPQGLAGETPAGPSVTGLLFPRLPWGHAVQLSYPSVWRAEAPRAGG